jgi:hypothetical protein
MAEPSLGKRIGFTGRKFRGRAGTLKGGGLMTFIEMAEGSSRMLSPSGPPANSGYWRIRKKG